MINNIASSIRNFVKPIYFFKIVVIFALLGGITALQGACSGGTTANQPLSNTAKDITSFNLAGTSGTITGTNIAVTVPHGTDVTNLIATFVTTGQSVTIGSTTQTSGVTANNFTSSVAYTVHAQDGSTKNYTVSVVVTAPRYMYTLGEGSSGINKCVITADGNFTNCTIAFIPLNELAGIATISLNGITYLYLGDLSSARLYKCVVNNDTGALTCATTSQIPNNLEVIGVATDKNDKQEGYAYIITRSSSYGINTCSINSGDGGIANCIFDAINELVTSNAVYNNGNGQKFLYITALSNNIWRCNIDSTNGSLSHCSISAHIENALHMLGIAVANLSHPHLYISDATQGIFSCDLASASGDLSNCINIDSGTDYFGIFFDAVTHTLYVPSGENPANIYRWSVNNDGGLFNRSDSGYNSTPVYYMATVN